MGRHQALLVLCAAVWTFASAQIPDFVVHLDESNFEHDTQAGTGQTTGAWFVLFNTPASRRYHIVRSIWENLAKDEDKEVIFAEVNLEDPKNKGLARRFKMIQPPAGVLFRDRQMYVYPRVLKTGVDDDVREWLTGEIPLESGEPVPSAYSDKPVKPPMTPEEEARISQRNRAIGFALLLMGVCMHGGIMCSRMITKARLEKQRARQQGAGGQQDPLAAPAAQGSKAKDT